MEAYVIRGVYRWSYCAPVYVTNGDGIRLFNQWPGSTGTRCWRTKEGAQREQARLQSISAGIDYTVVPFADAAAPCDVPHFQ